MRSSDGDVCLKFHLRLWCVTALAAAWLGAESLSVLNRILVYPRVLGPSKPRSGIKLSLPLAEGTQCGSRAAPFRQKVYAYDSLKHGWGVCQAERHPDSSVVSDVFGSGAVLHIMLQAKRDPALLAKVFLRSSTAAETQRSIGRWRLFEQKFFGSSKRDLKPPTMEEKRTWRVDEQITFSETRAVLTAWGHICSSWETTFDVSSPQNGAVSWIMECWYSCVRSVLCCFRLMSACVLVGSNIEKV